MAEPRVLGRASLTGPSTWEALLKQLPSDPWDLLTDYARAEGCPGTASGTICSVGLPANSGELADLALIAAVCVALGTCDHGRDSLWVLDCSPSYEVPLPLRVDLAGAGSLEDLRQQLSRSRAEAQAVCTAAGANAAAQLRQAAAQGRFAAQRAHGLCQVAFGLDRSALEQANRLFLQGEPPPDFCVSTSEPPCLLYRGDLYDEATALAVGGHASRLLQCLADWPSLAPSQAAVKMLDTDERELVLRRWNNTTTPFKQELCIHEFFERCARGKYKNSTAIIPVCGSVRWTYADLDAAAGTVSGALAGVGNVGHGQVGILVRRSPALIASVYGVLRAGHAYVPLDPEWPAARQLTILEDVEACALVVGEDLQPPTATWLPAVVRLATAPQQRPSLRATLELGASPGRQTAPRPADAPRGAYVLYTSGTTGKPKGVDVPHFGLVGRTEWLQHTWPLSDSQVVVQKTPLTFAISEWEIFWPLCYGAQLALVADGLHGDSQHVAQVVEQRGVTHSVFVPSLLEQLLEELDGRPLPSLKLIIACGEALRPKTLGATRKALPNTELSNLYGPTEGSMTMVRFTGDPTAKDLLRFPIGVPIENTSVLCSLQNNAEKRSFEPAPVLTKGELGFAGPLIATGYWRLPELTTQKFVPNPHGQGRVYLTGDLGRWRSDGTLEFLGRVDQQVKFNGVRIELGEIETALAALPGVASAVAFLSPPHLVAACTLLGGTPADGAGKRAKLMEGLGSRLPKYSLPTRLELLPVLPTTDRGKVDRKKLVEGFAQREAERASAGSGKLTGAAPATDSEFAIERALREVLGEDAALPVDASFQEMGFSSLMLGKLTARVRRHFALPSLPATSVYRHPSVRELAAEVDKLQAEERAAGTADAVVPAAPLAWRGGSPTSPLSCVCTFLGLLAQTAISELAFLPAYYVLFHLYFTYDLWVLFVCIAPVLLFDRLFTLFTAVVLKWVIIGRRRPGNFPIFGRFYWKWWFIHAVEKYVEQHVESFFTDTVFFNVYLRLMGAQVGPRVRFNKVHLSEADLLVVGADTRIEREVTLTASRLWCGELQLRRIIIGRGVHIEHRAFISADSHVPDGLAVVPMATADKFGAFKIVPRCDGVQKPSGRLTRLQTFLGIPIIMLIEALSFVPVVYCMISLWSLLEGALFDADLAAQVSALTERRLQEGSVQVGPARGGGRGSIGERQPPTSVVGRMRGYTLGGDANVLYPFCILLPWVFCYVHGISYFILAVLVKWLVAGRFRAGPITSTYRVFTRWLVERLTTVDTFNMWMELWVNTELLSLLYRMLGANIAPRVNMDYFGAVEYDLITVERDVVFGSSVLLVTNAKGVAKPVVVRTGACVLDHSCVMPGSVVPQGALMGSFTVLPEGTELEAMTVYTGCDDGGPVRLFRRALKPGQHVDGQQVIDAPAELTVPLKVEPTPAPAVLVKQHQLEAAALRRHQSCFWLTIFNIWCIISAFIFAPLPDLCYWCTILVDFEIYDLFGEDNMGELVSLLLLAPLHVMAVLIQAVTITCIKWALIGKWTAGDRPFYSWFHFRWAALMTALASLDDLVGEIEGTWLSTFFLRCMGANVGKQVAFFGHGFEYDLLKIGDKVAIGSNCDVTAHTVENMVMRMEEVRFEEGSSCMDGSVVMPGGHMDPYSTLIEHSLVLKGEVVPNQCVFGGLPAKLLRNYPGREAVAKVPSDATLQGPRAAGAAVLGAPVGAAASRAAAG